jgi:hypothetical protein
MILTGVIKSSQSVLYREIIAVCSEIHTKHIHTLCGQNVEFVNVNLGGIHNDHWALEGKAESCFTFGPNCLRFGHWQVFCCVLMPFC